MQTLLPYLNRALRNYFNQQPAYVLREDGSQGEAMAKKLAKGIEVKPVKLSFRLRIIDEGAFAPFIFRAKENVSAYPLCPAKTSLQPEHRD